MINQHASWFLPNQVGNWYTTFDQEDAATVSRPANIIQSQFPPSTEELASGRFPLDRCMRFFPHHGACVPPRVALWKPSHRTLACGTRDIVSIEGSAGEPLLNADGKPHAGRACGSFGLSRGSWWFSISPI